MKKHSALTPTAVNSQPLVNSTAERNAQVSDNKIPAIGSDRPIRILSLIEANVVTGPAKNLLEFSAEASTPRAGLPRVESFIATFHRGERREKTAFMLAAEQMGFPPDILKERSAFDPRVLPQLRALINRHDPDIIQSLNFKSHFLVRLLALHHRRRWIAFHHGYTWTDLKNRVYNQFDRWSLPAADHVVTVCRPFAEELEKIGVAKEHISVRHNSIQPFIPAPADDVSALRRTLGIEDDKLVVISVGRFSKEKGHIDLIEALGKLKPQQLESMRLVLLGGGPEKTAVSNRAHDLGLGNFVVFGGHQTNLTPYYTMANIAVLPSHSEGSPYALLEAMAAGLPVVATRVGGVPEIAIPEQTALLVKKENPAELAHALTLLIENDGLRRRLGSAGKQISQNYDPEVYCRSMLQLYADVMKAAPR